MKFISFGKVDKKIIQICAVIIIIYVFINLIEYLYFKNNEGDILKNDLLNLLIEHGLLALFEIPEYIIRRRLASEKIEKQKKGLINNNKVIYIFNFPYKASNIKKLIISIIIIVLYYIFELMNRIIQKTYSPVKTYFSQDYMILSDILCLYLIFRLKHKTIFYKHQNISLVLIFVMEVTRYLYELFNFRGINNFKFPENLHSIISPILFTLFSSIFYYSLKYFMQYNYYSPIFISFLIGIIYTILSIILLIIFLNIDCGAKEFCILLSETKNISGISILLYILISIFSAIEMFLILLIIYYFSIFHIAIPFIFLDLFQYIFNLIAEFDKYELIIIIFTFSIEILSIFLFLEIIELNFCGFTYNLNKNIVSILTKLNLKFINIFSILRIF